ncbi:MAG: dolichyl-phosphate beta-glucosyltransferase [Thermoanaerobaculales bacterium]|jgi:dolichyl-phosphate beta-glucosyltransferase
MLSLSVIIPAYNEAARLPATLARLVSFLAEQPHLLPAEVVVVDDGSTDGTADIVARFAAPEGVAVRLLRLAHNAGKGAGVRAGMAASRGAMVLFSDADLATPIEEIDTLRAARVAVAVGSRALDRALISRRQPLARDYLGRLYNLALRVLGLTTMRDTQCGFKLLDGALARRLAGELRLDGFAFDIELLARAQRAGATVAEVPVHWHHVDDSRVKPFRHGLMMFRDALRVRWWLWQGR